MCYKYARVFNEELSLPPRSEFFRPPPFMGVNFVPDPPRLMEDNVIVVAPPGLFDELVEDLDFFPILGESAATWTSGASLWVQ